MSDTCKDHGTAGHNESRFPHNFVPVPPDGLLLCKDCGLTTRSIETYSMCVAGLYDALQDAVLDSDLKLIGPVELDKLDQAEVMDMKDDLLVGGLDAQDRFLTWVEETWYDERGLAANDLVRVKLNYLIAGEMDEEEAWFRLDEYDPDWLAIAEGLALQHDQSDPADELLTLLGVTLYQYGGELLALSDETKR